jgi:hypothetical protein
MRTLLLAAILYLVGVVVILLTRPALMFDKAGQWKEFGTLSSEHTIFPFWLFCIMWAVLSYCITLFFMGAAPTGSKKVSEPAPVRTPRSGKRSKSGKAAAAAPPAPPESQESLVEPLPVKKSPKPGYYVLNDESTQATGTARYVYYGTEPPDLMGEE